MKNILKSVLLLAALAVGAFLPSTIRAQSNVDYSLQLLQLMGSPLVAESAPLLNGGGRSLTTGTIHFVAIPIYGFSTINGVIFCENTPASFTPTGFNGAGLYAYNPAPGALTLQMFSSNSASWFEASATSLNEIVFTGPQALSGVYFVAFLTNYSTTTHPPDMVINGGVLAGISQMLPNGGMLGGYLAGQSSLPASLNISQLTPEMPLWAGLSNP